MLVRTVLTQKGVIMIHLIVSIIVGAFIGWVAGQNMGTEKKGFFVNAVLGHVRLSEHVRLHHFHG